VKTTSILISSMVVQMKQTFSRPMYKMCLLITPIFTTIMLAEMFKNSAAENFTSYVVLGSGLMSFWSCTVFSSIGDINRERYSNTLAKIFVAPSRFIDILIGKILGNTILSLVSFAVTLITAMLLYGQPIVINNPFQFVLAYLAMFFCFVVVSIFFAYLLTLSRKTAILMNCLEIPLALICGFAFPIEILPAWTKIFSYVLPQTWAVKLLRQGVAGVTNVEFGKTLIILVLVTAIFAIISLGLYKTIEKQIRVSASLEVA